MSELKCGDRVEVKEGEFKGSVGIVRGVKETKKVSVQVDFIGKRKSLPQEFLHKIGSKNQELTSLETKPVELVNAEFDEVEK